MADKSNLTPINGKGKSSLSKDTFREFKENFKMHCEFIAMQAKMTKIKFDALKEEGFNDVQALELSKTLF